MDGSENNNGNVGRHASPSTDIPDRVAAMRAKEQRKITSSGEDTRILKKAMMAFTTLQHVQLLRLIEPSMSGGQAFLDAHWLTACTHAIQTMSEALMYANSSFSRFSGPMIHPHSMLDVQGRIPRVLHSHATQLTCLELHFDAGLDLQSKIVELANASFAELLIAAENLQVLHIGFPSRAPLDLSLDRILHGTYWPKLRAFGVQAWRLEASEIINWARRHRRTLRGLRLRDVQLKAGGRWQDVLAVLRTEMEALDWVSLRRIDYAAHFDEVWSGAVEVPDEPPGGASDSDEESSFPEDLSDEDSDVDNSGEDSYDDSDNDIDDIGPDTDDLAHLPHTPASLPFCTCSDDQHSGTIDDLGDNGIFVTYHQRKTWEKWVVGRCPEHGLR